MIIYVKMPNQYLGVSFMSLEIGQRKWNMKTAAAFRAKWVAAVKSADSFDSWCEGLAAATGLSKGQIASSMPLGC